MRLLSSSHVVFALCIFASIRLHADEYSIRIDAEVTGDYTIDTRIETSLPDGVTLAASLGLSGLRPDDTAIGTSFVRVPVADGKSRLVIDGRERTLPMGVDLPAGVYDLEVAFHPKWKENREIAATIGVDDSIRTAVEVTLTGSGTDKGTVIDREAGQRWVMENVFSGTQWDYGFWIEKHGEVEHVVSTGSLNPDVIKFFYIPEIDMTFMVNIPRRQIETWRLGRVSE